MSHRRRQDSELEYAPGHILDVANEDRMVNNWLRFKVLMDHNGRSVAAMPRPKNVTGNTVRVVCDWLETSKFRMCSLKCQNGTAEITSHNAVDKTRRVETILRNIFSRNDLGHSKSDVKQAEKTDTCNSPSHVHHRPQIRRCQTCGTNNRTLHVQNS